MQAPPPDEVSASTGPALRPGRRNAAPGKPRADIPSPTYAVKGGDAAGDPRAAFCCCGRARRKGAPP